MIILTQTDMLWMIIEAALIFFFAPYVIKLMRKREPSKVFKFLSACVILILSLFCLFFAIGSIILLDLEHLVAIVITAVLGPMFLYAGVLQFISFKKPLNEVQRAVSIAIYLVLVALLTFIAIYWLTLITNHSYYWWWEPIPTYIH